MHFRINMFHLKHLSCAVGSFLGILRYLTSGSYNCELGYPVMSAENIMVKRAGKGIEKLPMRGPTVMPDLSRM